MPFTEEYRELMDTARDALDKLLRASKQEAWITLRQGYGELGRMLALDETQKELERLQAEQEEKKAERLRDKERWEREYRERKKRERAWKETPRERRESLLLHALGEDRLVMRELAERIQAQWDPDAGRQYRAIFETHVRPLVKRMHEAGQLDREADPSAGKRVRYRYFRRGGLDGPIADLERAYHHDDDGRAE